MKHGASEECAADFSLLVHAAAKNPRSTAQRISNRKLGNITDGVLDMFELPTIVHRAVARFDIMMSTTHLAMDWVEYLCKMSKYN